MRSSINNMKRREVRNKNIIVNNVVHQKPRRLCVQKGGFVSVFLCVFLTENLINLTLNEKNEMI